MWCEYDQNIHEILQEKNLKKNKKQTKFSFLCLTPVLPKGVSISVAFFLLWCTLDTGGSDCSSGGLGELGGSHS